MCHASGVRHAGNVITAGVRWVLVVFLLGQETPQYARRCAEAASLAKAHAQALMREGGDVDAVVESLEAVDVALAAGLSVAPGDHELHHAMAALHAMRDDPPAARVSLRTAAELYPMCPKPRNALGSMLIATGRYRAALRHFETAFTLAPTSHTADALATNTDSAEDNDDESIADSIEDDDAWEAAVNGALCIVELLATRGASPLPLSRALSWLRGALAAAPDEPRLLALLRRAEALRQ